MKKIPVILDTDIGGDIDDTWALAMMLKCPELDVKLVVSDTRDTPYRAKLIAKLLEVAGRTDLPVGIGIRQSSEGGPQAPWLAGYDLADYPGTVHADGVQAIIDTIMSAPEPLTLICIGPMPNIKAALAREPKIADRTRFVGMHGCVGWSPWGEQKQIAEYNVVEDIPASQAVFSAPWDITITPLDTCGLVVLDGPCYQRVLKARQKLPRAVIENYRAWAKVQQSYDPALRSSVLFDTVAIYLAFAHDLLNLVDLKIVVDGKGFMQQRDDGKLMHVALTWNDLAGFKDFLVARLLA